MREKLRERIQNIDDFFTVEGLKNNWYLISLVGIFALAVWLRYIPAGGMQYLQALDPYMIYRMSQHFAFEGSLPALDFLRYFPYAQPVYKVQLGDIIFPAIFYHLGPSLIFDNYMEWAQFYPALMGGLSVVFAYFFGKEVWNKTAGLSSAFFLATISGVMHRTSAGFFEKEPLGVMFMMMSLYFFTRAWKREDWLSGIVSGLALAGFTMSWGGSSMLWLLYPLTVGTVMLLDEDIDSLIRCYTPIVIIGGCLAAVFEPGRLGFTSDMFLANFGLLGLLWSRKFVEELEIIDREYLGYYIPGMSALGLVAILLSPLYSDFIASQVMSIIGKVTQENGAVIAGTVAENQAAGIGQIVTQLNSLSASQVHPLLGLPSQLVGPWPLMFVAVALMGTSLLLMLLKKYEVIEDEITDRLYYSVFAAVFLVWTLSFAIYFKYFVGQSPLYAIAPAVLATIGGGIFLNSFKDMSDREIEFRWYYFLPLFWIITNVLTAVSKSRIVFLAAFPVAVGAGYTLSAVLNQIREIDFSDAFEGISGRQTDIALFILVLLPVISVNVAAGYASVQNLGGSPNNLWMENLEWLESETEPGENVLSWWDYGYHFQSIGRSPSVADGGNAGYYSDEKYGKVNYPIADFFTSSNPENHTELFKKHSVDYLVLDNTMIGKYSAVSQISNRDNSEFNSMITLDTNNLRQSLSQDGNRTVAQFTNRRQRLSIYVPLSIQDNSAEISGEATLDANGRRIPVDCVLTDEGKKEIGGESESDYCITEDPFYSLENSLSQQGFPAQVVLVPKEIADASLVRLYLMNGHGIDFVEKVPEASNGYVETWEVDLG